MLVLWICLCAFLNCMGWMLSVLHQLNGVGYLVALCLAALAWICFRLKTRQSLSPPIQWRPRWQRMRRGFPLLFLCLAGLAILGGILNPPSNYDGLAYRVPRSLHWLAAEQWHWIHTDFPRLNTRATGFEWLSTPLIALTQSDRFIFLINAVNFLFLPGLFFSVLTRMGVSRRVAATWMWLLPTGYCYLLQAGSIGNDMTGSFYALAAVSFALRARSGRSLSDFWISILAAGLLSSGKTSNLPLMLPWLIAIAPAWRTALRQPLVTAGICLVAAGSSFLPIAAINTKHVGDWTGLAAEGLQLTRGEPAVRVANNTVLQVIQNFVPPIFPVANAWNRSVVNFIPQDFAKRTAADFEPAGARWQLSEMQVEEGAGLGFGISVLLAISVGAGLASRRNSLKRDWRHVLLLLAPWVAFLAFMLKSNLSTSARLAAPYYGLIVPLLLVIAGHERLVRVRWWRWSAVLLTLPAALLLIVSPPRPLWPAKTILTKLAQKESPSPLVQRALTVYSVYGMRSDGFKPVRERLPSDANPLGFVATDEVETSLWKPFGSRRILHVKATDTRAQLQERGIRYVLVSTETWERLGKQSLESWFADLGADVVETFTPRLRAGKEPFIWYLIRLRPENEGVTQPKDEAHKTMESNGR
jgi:hypothetical protein